MKNLFSTNRPRGARPLRGLLAGLALLLAPAGAALAQTTTIFAYTGSPETYQVPAGVTRLRVEAQGGSGGGGGLGFNSGLGAVVSAVVTVVPGEVLSVRVGGSGSNTAGAPGGYNGGGNAAATNSGSGGGASDVRRTGASTGDHMTSRNALVVAGGGGGSGSYGDSGGNGGTPNGGDSAQGGTGATTTGTGVVGNPGVNSQGGNGLQSGFGYGGGGGGGYYGGSGGNHYGGGGGSSFVMVAGSGGISYNTLFRGNGVVRLTPAPSEPTITTLNPNSGPQGTSVTITGTNFTGASTVSFAGTAGNNVTFTSATSLTANVPFGATTGNVTVTTASGTSNGVNFTVTAGPPVLTSLSPTSGSVGRSVTLTGTGFTPTSTVSFGGTAATSVAFVSAATLTAVVPAGATSGNVTVQNTNGTSNGVPFTVVPPPTITGLSPTSGPVGSTVTITGAGFDLGGNNVRFNGVLITSGITNSATSITADVPAGATTGNVTVQNTNGTSNGVLFTLPAAPTITSFSPPGGPVGTSVAITGTGFTAASTVDFNGTAATSITYNSAASLTVVVPTGATTGNVTVTTANGTSNGVSFTVGTVFPVITSLSLTSGPVGSTVTITGTDFDLGGNDVRFNGVLITSGSTNSATSITAVVPAGATTGNVTVQNTNGTSNGVLFTVGTAAPDLTISTGTQNAPISIAAGTYTNITITGTGCAQLGGAVVVDGALLVEGSGGLDTNCQSLGGAGRFTLAAGATLLVCDAAGLSATGATGAVQVTGTRSFDPDALYAYNGSAAQSTGFGLPATVRALAVGNAAGLTLSQDVAATLTVVALTGVLTTGSHRVTLGSAATLSETETAYVVGKVATTRPLALGTAEPFGGLGLTLTPAAGSRAPGSTLVVRTTGTALTGAGTSTSVLRSFDIQPAVNAGLNVAMNFAYFTHELNGIAPANLALFKSVTTTAGPWANQRPVTLDAAAKTVSKAGIADFSIWTLGSAQAPLPVTLTAFAAERQGAAARLTWATASEKNSAYFEAEASPDGRAFRAVGRVAAQGSTAQAYELRDSGLLAYGAPVVYYRLRQVDLDGTFSYSPVRTLAISSGPVAFEAVAWPNPAGAGRPTQLLVRCPASAHPLELTLTDAAGHQMARRMVAATEAAAGSLALPETAGLPTGVYWLVVRQGGARQVLRLLHE